MDRRTLPRTRRREIPELYRLGRQVVAAMRPHSEGLSTVVYTSLLVVQVNVKQLSR